MISISFYPAIKATLFLLLLLFYPTLTQSNSFSSESTSSSQELKRQNFFGLFDNHNEKPFLQKIQSKLFIKEETVDSDTLNPLTERHYIKILSQNNFFGTWESHNKDEELFQGFFRNQKGLIVIEATETNLAQAKNAVSQITSVLDNKTIIPTSYVQRNHKIQTLWNLYVKLYDGNYVDKKSANIFFEVTSSSPIQFDSENATFSSREGIVEIFLKDEEGNGFFYKKCQSEFSLAFVDNDNLQPYKSPKIDLSTLGIQYKIISPECGLALSTEILESDGFRNISEVNIYVLVVSAIALIKMTGGFQVKQQLKNRKVAFRISVGSIWMMATVDYYLLMINLVLAFAFSFRFLLPFFLYMFHAFFLERDIILRILQARSKHYGPDVSDESCKSCGFYFALSTCLFFIELIFIMMAKFWIIHLTALVFIPQIIDNAKRDKAYYFNFYHIFLMGTSHIGFIIYMKLYSHNIFKLSPDVNFIATYAAIIAVQIMILLIQMISPRGCFSCLWKKKRIRSTIDDDTCPICMGELKRDFITNGDSLLDYRQVVETPCTHVFHVDCLKQWMVNKIECPICREDIEQTYEEVVSSEDDGSQAQLQL